MIKKLFSYIAIIALVVSLIPFSTVSAVETPNCDEEFYAGNDILYYNPCQAFCTGTPGATTSKIEKLSGANNAEKMYNFWISAGLTPAQSAGVVGSMKHEGGFSPFRQEIEKPWPNWGWGIAQFTGQPGPDHPDTGGERKNVKDYLINELGQELFNQYYKAEYGGSVYESDGYIPKGVPKEVNDAFLLGELNYLLETIEKDKSNDIRISAYTRDFGISVTSGDSIFEHIKSLKTAGEAAVAWTYLYEWPGYVKSTSEVRIKSANEISEFFTNSGSSDGNVCGSISDGGMNLEQARRFMETYKQIDNGDPNGDKQYLEGATCSTGSTLTDNCVRFSSYFVNKYTNKKFGISHGAKVVNQTLAANPDIQSGTLPQPFALFSVSSGSMQCDYDNDNVDDAPCGHTGVVLGVDKAKGTIIIGEASFCNPSFTGAKEVQYKDWANGKYIYAYLQPYVQAEKL